MGKFIQFIFASCLGFLLAGAVVFFVGSAVVGKIVSSADAAPDVKPNTVLDLSFSSIVPEKTNNSPVDEFSFDTETKIGLHEMVKTIEHAKDNEEIKGIYIDLSSVPMGRASASILRDALIDFKSDGKFIVAYSDYYSQGTYYLASVANKVFVNPIGSVEFNGFGVQIPFFKDMLDRIGVNMQVYYAGDFKSATEPFRRESMSDENRLQTRQYVNNLYNLYLEDIAKSRDLSVSELKKIAEHYKIRTAEDALSYNMVDAVGYEDEARGAMRDFLGLDDDADINRISLQDYNKGATFTKDYKVKDRIAVVYAEGNIVDGEADPGSIGGDKYAKILRKLRTNDKVKAVVLRVNSGGGSAMASEVMWREIELLKKEGKPVVASMGDLAASGGYYISSGADSIFADANTLTGSIGVFSMIPSFEQMLDDKVGVTFDTVATGPFAIGLTPFKDISPEEGVIIQEMTDRIYETFLKRVADGRDMTRDEVHKIAQGRVWTGQDAQQIGLVDRIGGLEEALAAAADLAGLEKYRVSEYPVTKDPLQQMIEQFTGQKVQAKAMLEQELSEVFPHYKYLKELKTMEGVQARIPFAIEFN